MAVHGAVLGSDKAAYLSKKSCIVGGWPGGEKADAKADSTVGGQIGVHAAWHACCMRCPCSHAEVIRARQASVFGCFSICQSPLV